jgi:hypothetical protein
MQFFRKIFLLSSIVAAIAPAGSVAADEDEELILGTIEFPTTGSPEAQVRFLNGVKALHSFWYEEARDQFSQAQQLDPSFGMAYWGEVMSYDNAFGTVAIPDYEQHGEAALSRVALLDSRGLLEWSEKERGLFEAVKIRFQSGAGIADKRRGYGQAMERLVERYPDDDEIQVFAALALMSFPAFDREQASHVILAAAPLEEIYERNTEHPGVLHYLIHAYDTPAFARLGLRQARRYAAVAQSAPHAVHMPSHIYKHLGMWQEVIDANVASYAISVDWQQKTDRPLHMRDFHTFNWLLEAYLATGLFDEARGLMAELEEIEAEIAARGEDPNHFPTTAARMRQLYTEVTGISIQ